jgi:hypothetical protein
MKQAVIGALAAAAVLVACNPAQPASQPQAPPLATRSAEDSAIQASNDRLVADLLTSIGEKRNQPSDSVFENVRWLKNIPAAQFLSIMNGGYAKALGVRCSYCHVSDDFASDDKRPKRAAREMAVMHRMINQELRKMENLETPQQNRAINCITCHGGRINPMAPRANSTGIPR